MSDQNTAAASEVEVERVVDFESVDDAISTYVELRDNLRVHMKEAKAVEDNFKTELVRIEMWLRDMSDKLGVDSFKTQSGTAYKVTNEFYRIGAIELFNAYVLETGNLQLFEKRVAKNAAREIHKTDGTVPPGLDYTTEIGFNVKRPTKSKQEASDE